MTKLEKIEYDSGGEYYDYEIIKDYDINNERRYTILTGGEEVEKLIIYPDKSYFSFLTMNEIKNKILQNLYLKT